MSTKLVEFSAYTLIWLVATSCVASAVIAAITKAGEVRIRKELSALAVLLDSVALAALRGNGSEVKFQLPASLPVCVKVSGRRATVEFAGHSYDVQLSYNFKPAVIRPAITVVARATKGAVELGVDNG